MAYFPNSTEGDYLDAQCADCPARCGCPIFAVQMRFNYEQLRKGKESLKEAMTMLIDDKGKCRMRPLIIVLTPVFSDPLAWMDT